MPTLIGTNWRHQNRGTTYQVLGVFATDLTGINDDDEAYWIDRLIPPRHSISVVRDFPEPVEGTVLVFAIPVRLQIEIARAMEIVVIYQDTVDRTIWCRPEDEFLDGRFKECV